LTGSKRQDSVSQGEVNKGVRRWFSYYPLSLSRVAFLFQRITGIGLTVFFIIHVITIGLFFNPFDWISFINTVETPLGWLGLIIMISAIGFHLVNGFRLTLAEFGFNLGNPTRPDFPYKIHSLNIFQKSIIILAIIVALLSSFIGYLFIFLGV
jgi:succinate dehydrogenase/fumarate reductase cytochrome b subunit